MIVICALFVPRAYCVQWSLQSTNGFGAFLRLEKWVRLTLFHVKTPQFFVLSPSDICPYLYWRELTSPLSNPHPPPLDAMQNLNRPTEGG